MNGGVIAGHAGSHSIATSALGMPLTAAGEPVLAERQRRAGQPRPSFE